MKKVIFVIVIVLTNISCDRETPIVDFTISINEFEWIYDGNRRPENIGFSHKYSGATVRFTTEDKVYNFHTRTLSVEAYSYSLPPGYYSIDFLMIPASLYGQPNATFHIEDTIVHISEGMTSLELNVKPDCALFLVSDKKDQLTEGPYIIQRYQSGNGHFMSYPLTYDTVSGLYYSYFTPDPSMNNPSAYLWFYTHQTGAEQGGYSTVNCKNGTVYYFEILD